MDLRCGVTQFRGRFVSLHLLYPCSCVHTSSCLYSVAMTQEQDWGGALHQRIAKAIRNAREGRMSAQELADETERLGYPISRSQIANYESGRKQSLDVAELLVLAAALGLPPALLLFPTFPDEKVELIPGKMVDTSRSVGWLSGDSAMESGQSNAGTELVQAVARLASIDDDLFRLRGMEPVIAKPAVVESMKRVIRDREEQSAAVKARIDKAKAALWGDSSDGSVDE